MYHLSASGITNWYEYACYIISRASTLKKKFHVTPGQIKGVSSSEQKRDAKRPANSVLDTSKFQKAFNIKIPNWQMGVDEILDEICNEQ